MISRCHFLGYFLNFQATKILSDFHYEVEIVKETSYRLFVCFGAMTLLLAEKVKIIDYKANSTWSFPQFVSIQFIHIYQIQEQSRGQASA